MEDPPAMISIILVIFVICKLSQFRERKVKRNAADGRSGGPPCIEQSTCSRIEGGLNAGGAMIESSVRSVHDQVSRSGCARLAIGLRPDLLKP
jgi:hypothetical protein